MELAGYTVKELYLAAMRSEIDARAVYRGLAGRIKNAYLRDRLLFLAGEEEKHRRHLMGLYKREFGRGRVAVPASTPVPLPKMKPPERGTPVSEVIEAAMEAERAAMDFYTSFAARFERGSEQARALSYLAQMELGHYKLLETERELMVREEWFDTEWPMMHVGP